MNDEEKKNILRGYHPVTDAEVVEALDEAARAIQRVEILERELERSQGKIHDKNQSKISDARWQALSAARTIADAAVLEAASLDQIRSIEQGSIMLEGVVFDEERFQRASRYRDAVYGPVDWDNI